VNPGGLFSVALSLGFGVDPLPPPGVTRHRSSVEPGLSSHSRPKPGARGHPAIRSLHLSG